MKAEHYKFPLSFAQQRLWFLDQLEGPGTVYTIRLPVRLTGPLNRAALQEAVDFIVARHESLRTTFAPGNGQGNGQGEPVQVIAANLDVPVQWHELTDTNPEAIRARVAELAAVPFELATGPLFRVHVVKIAADEHLLLLLTISSRMPGHRVSCSATWPPSTMHWPPARRRSCRNCRCNTPITRSGNVTGSMVRNSSGN